VKPVSEFSTALDESAALCAAARDRIRKHAWAARSALENITHTGIGTAEAAIAKAEHELALCWSASHSLRDYERMAEQAKGGTR